VDPTTVSNERGRNYAVNAPVPDEEVDEQRGGGLSDARVKHARRRPVHQLVLNVLWMWREQKNDE